MVNVIELDLTNIRQDFKDCVITIGFFDGLHKMHQKILKTAKKIAIKNNLKLAFFTFESKKNEFKIFEKTIKYDLINNLVEPDYILEMPNLSTNYHLRPSEFLDILKNKLHVKKVVVGKNFHFGYNAIGTVDDIKKAFGRQNVLTVHVNPFISSTIIRHYINEGKYRRVKHLNKFGLLANVEKKDDYYQLKIDYQLVDGKYLLEIENNKVKTEIKQNCFHEKIQLNKQLIKIIKFLD